MRDKSNLTTTNKAAEATFKATLRYHASSESPLSCKSLGKGAFYLFAAELRTLGTRDECNSTTNKKERQTTFKALLHYKVPSGS